MLIKLRKRNRIFIDEVASLLLIVGALNWGLVAFGFNAVEWILGVNVFTNIVYGIVGLSGLWTIFRKPITGKSFMN